MAAVAELLAGGALEESDALAQAIGELLLGVRHRRATIAAQSSTGSTKAGGTGRPSAAMRARLAALAPTISAECRLVDPSPIRTICMTLAVLS